MIETIDDSTSASTAAARLAARNWAANSRALGATQPAFIEDDELPTLDVEWIFGRDGSLSALDVDGRWWKGCSLPSRSAEFMLRKATLEGTVPCFLLPSHAAQLRKALDRMTPQQALLALTPDWQTLRMILACEDFSEDIAAHRLYFAAGEQWEAQLDRLLADLPGLPTPTQFIRPIVADSAPADALIAPAQKIFADHSNRRAQKVRILRETWKRADISRICLVAPANFRLWDDAGEALAQVMADVPAHISISRFNSDDPASASSAGLAMAAAQCNAIVMPNMGRADLPDLMPDAMPWATWLTSPRIPSAQKAGPNDTLLVADANWKTLAIEQDWKSESVFIAGWPTRECSQESGVFRVETKPALAIISDTQPLDPPARVIEYSSHRLLWESIREELLNNPFALEDSIDAYLADRMRKARIEDEGFDRRAFVDGVILHAWQQGVARLLLRERVPLKLFGNGWEEQEEFREFAAGPVCNRESLDRAVASAVALVHAWPKAGAHPIESMGKPVICAGTSQATLIREAKLALNGKFSSGTWPREFLKGTTILRALGTRGDWSAIPLPAVLRISGMI